MKTDPITYVSTRGKSPALTFDDVLLDGLAPDGGLYVPAQWPVLERLPSGDYTDIAKAVMRPFVQGGVVGGALDDLVETAYSRFRHPEVAPLAKVGEKRHLLELFWGPTLSFKDYALQLVGGMFELVLGTRGERVQVVGATSGDTGSAAIEALAGREGVDVVILFPLGRISEIQRLQMTTVADSNVLAVAVDGTFDDCQDLVKAAFGSEHLRKDLHLAAVNSINWARVMAQAVYHTWSAVKVGEPITVSVPTGNFGNVFAADVARRMGVPIEHFIVANNQNHGLSDLISTGRILLEEVIPTSSPAMDIQISSNLERELFELFDRDGTALTDFMARLRRDGGAVLDEVRLAAFQNRFEGHWYSDDRLAETIGRVYSESGMLIEPHTAAGWLAAEESGDERPVVSIATAHPAKFPEVVEAATGVAPELPAWLGDLKDRPERYEVIPPDLADLTELLVSR